MFWFLILVGTWIELFVSRSSLTEKPEFLQSSWGCTGKTKYWFIYPHISVVTVVLCVKAGIKSECPLPDAFLLPSPHVWAPRSCAWSPPSPDVGRRPVGPGEGCCCDFGLPSAPPSSRQWGTWVSAAGQRMKILCSSCQKPVHYTRSSCLTWNNNRLLNWFDPSNDVIIFTINTAGVQPGEYVLLKFKGINMSKETFWICHLI